MRRVESPRHTWIAGLTDFVRPSGSQPGNAAPVTNTMPTTTSSETHTVERLTSTLPHDLELIEVLAFSGHFPANDPVHVLARECARLRRELNELKKVAVAPE